MDDFEAIRLQEFESLGELEVRRRFAANNWSEEKTALARQWIEFRASLDNKQSLALAKEANDLARASLSSAEEANDFARNSVKTAEEANLLASNANSIALLSSESAKRSAKIDQRKENYA